MTTTGPPAPSGPTRPAAGRSADSPTGPGPAGRRADSPTAASDTPVTITAYEDGPLLVRGDFVLRTPDGIPMDRRPGTVALCRCGRSALKPFCDGTHKVTGFRAGDGPDD